MKVPVGAHLTDDEFGAYLIDGSAEPEVAAHLGGCEICRGEIAAFGASVESFNAALTAWSESRPSARPAALPESRQSRPVMARVS